ncbi:75k gamma secalin [Phlyctema vagabunda]|uniref:75k gamma secalin n=1 Tax=Phlyctema vagabunda TaxID=108571 RepID=A0ABR4PUH7_9HELO
MAYPGGHENGYWSAQDQNTGYVPPNPRPHPIPNASPGAYYQARPPPQQQQPQIQQQWAQNGTGGHVQYAPNAYMMNRGYPLVQQQQQQQHQYMQQQQYYSPTQPQAQAVQQRYNPPHPQPQLHAQSHPQPQALKRTHSNASYVEPPQKRVNHSSYNSPQYSNQSLYSPQPPHVSRPPQSPFQHQPVTVTSSNILPRSVESPPINPATFRSPHVERTTISPSNFITNPPERTTTSPANLVKQSPQLQRHTISPANVVAHATKSNTQSPSNCIPRAPERNISISSHVPERNNHSPRPLNVGFPAQEKATTEPTNLSLHSQQATIIPANIFSRPEPATISPSSLMATPTESTIAPSNLISEPPGHATIEPSKLVAPRAATPQQRPQQLSVPLLLVSLAEEYFEAAHGLVPDVASILEDSYVESYNDLIATGLACLEGAMKKLRLPPRLEANVILRFAGVLYDEDTDNFMDAEVALTKGIGLCDRNRYLDLKYAMQFLLAQFMFKKNPKAAIKALDGYISDSHTYHHYSWVYAFRFLRASRAMQVGIVSDSHSGLQNIRSISDTASEQSDRGIFLLAALMEAMTHMQSSSPDATELVQRAIAAAWTYQLDQDSQIPQLTALTHILDVVCSLRQGHISQTVSKARSLQVMMDGEQKNSKWSFTSDVLAIPISRKRQDSHTVSRDTRSVLGIGNDGRDNLMISFLSRSDAGLISHLLYGLVLEKQKPLAGSKVFAQLLKFITDKDEHPTGVLSDVLRQARWHEQIVCYLYIYTALCRAAVTDWRTVKKHILEIKTRIERSGASLPEPLVDLAVYVEGVYYQGTGNTNEALGIFQDPRFKLSASKNMHLSPAEEIKRDLSILASLNLILILQEDDRRDLDINRDLLDHLEPFCKGHRNRDIQTAFQLLVATVQVHPPQPFLKSKEFLQYAMHGAQTTGNTLFLGIVLTLTYHKFFTNIVGDQALKSAHAAAATTKNSANALWASVAAGQLAQYYSAQGRTAESEEALQEAKRLDQRAFPDI